MAEPFLSEIRLVSFVYAPKGWALCDGQLLPINQNQALFSLLGTTFGGDGRVNFALPDLRGRVPVHVGSGHTLGERGGEQAHTLSIGEMTMHSHPPQASSNPGDSITPQGKVWAATKLDKAYSTGNADTLMNNSIEQVSSVGGNQAHLNMQPFLTLNYVIALQGIFPSPN